MTTGSDIAEAVAAAVRRRMPYTYRDEIDLHRELCHALGHADIWHDHEVRLDDRDRIDFLTADGVGIEVKVSGSMLDLARQVTRYAHHDEVVALIVVTTQAAHNQLPPEVAGVPVTVVSLISQGLL